MDCLADTGVSVVTPLAVGGLLLISSFTVLVLLRKRSFKLFALFVSIGVSALVLLPTSPSYAVQNNGQCSATASSTTSTTTDTPSDNGSGNPVDQCPGAPHTPDGSDGTGGCWPGPQTSGIPAGTTLAAYTGTCTLNDSTQTITITNQDVAAACPNGLKTYAGTFNITNSNLPGLEIYGANAHVTATDSNIFGGTDNNYSAVGVAMNPSSGNAFVGKNLNISGGKDSVECGGFCDVEDSYMHDQVSPSDGQHEQAWLASGDMANSNLLIRHNSMICSDPTGGCTADLSLFGDNGVVSGVTIDNNLFMASNTNFYWATYLGYSPGKNYPNPDHIIFTNNVFQKGTNGKTGIAGPVTSWLPAADGGTGNVWSNNKFDDGTVIAEPGV